MTAWPKQADCPAYYGNPDPNGYGVPSRSWEDANIQRLIPPWKMVLAWDVNTPVRSIRIHRKCVTSLAIVLEKIWDAYAHDQAKIEAANMHLYGGAYAFRLMRGSSHLSMHSYGCAIDLDPEHNKFGSNAGTMPAPVVSAFRAEGWAWGGGWAYPDMMHFQAATVL